MADPLDDTGVGGVGEGESAVLGGDLQPKEAEVLETSHHILRDRRRLVDLGRIHFLSEETVNGFHNGVGCLLVLRAQRV